MGLGQQLLVLVGLSGLAISQPLLSLLGDNPTVFTFHNVGGGRLVLYAIAVAVLPPFVLWLPAVAVHAVAPAGSLAALRLGRRPVGPRAGGVE